MDITQHKENRRMKWTNKKIAQLKSLWKKGSLAGEIGEVLGTSKSAIIGKANRLKCAPRQSGRLNSVPRKYNTSLNGHQRPRSTRKDVLEAILREMEPENPTTLESLIPNQCKFPLGKEEDRAELFCGRERWRGPRKHAPNYCKYHVHVAAKLEDPGKAIRP